MEEGVGDRTVEEEVSSQVRSMVVIIGKEEIVGKEEVEVKEEDKVEDKEGVAEVIGTMLFRRQGTALHGQLKTLVGNLRGIKIPLLLACAGSTGTSGRRRTSAWSP